MSPNQRHARNKLIEWRAKHVQDGALNPLQNAVGLWQFIQILIEMFESLCEDQP